MKRILTILLICFLAKILFAQEIVAKYELNGNGEDSGPNNYIANVNGVTPGEDRLGNPNGALSFDGIDDYMEILNQNKLNFGECDFAISFWMKTSSTNMQMILQNGSSGTIPQYWVRLKDYSSSSIDLKFITSNGVPTSPFIVFNDPSIFNGTWHHVVVQRVNYWHEIYFDGALVSMEENSEIKDIVNEDNILIGAQHPHPANGFPDIHNYFHGSLDDFIFYKGSLTLEQVEDLFKEEVTSTNVEKLSEDQIEIFPNPTTYNVIINMKGFEATETEVSIIDINGKILKSFNLIQNEINLNDLATGIYFIEFTFQGKTVTKKIIKN